MKGFEKLPSVNYDSGQIVVSPGSDCIETPGSSALRLAGSFFGLSLSALGASPTAVAGFTLLSFFSFSSAHDTTTTVTVDIYVKETDADKPYLDYLNDPIGCPPESFYWRHHSSVHNGYSGCVGEKYLLPCAQDSQGADDSALYSKTPINWNGTSCISTGYTLTNRTFWILWGDPLDKEELEKRTGMTPVVKFPFRRGPYPRYTYDTDETTALLDDASTAKAVAKDFLVYLGAMSASEKSLWYVSMTEGAEAGISILWAAKALEIAQTTCNRNIYVLMEVPAYGYSNSNIARLVNQFSSSFYSGSECLCYPDCKAGDVNLINVGYFPSVGFPERLGGDNVTYAATSTSEKSPWFESMVFPENPSGVLKTPQISDPNRRVCDGVYMWPMYFYSTGFQIPLAQRPDCSGWSFSITKGYSASVRAGFLTYKKGPTRWVNAVKSIMGSVNAMTNGLYSQWSWEGQMQLQNMIMSKPMDDKTSWVGAYSEIMKEKWDVISDAFMDCPVLELTNKGKGAYAFFIYKKPYTGLQSSTISSFFLNVLGVKATTYYWGFRGADPSTYYGEGIGVYDFTRLQLYRDLGVYKEVARRAKIVCADKTAKVDGYLSIDEWNAAELAKKRGRRLEDALSHLDERELERVMENDRFLAEFTRQTEECAPEYSTSCLFENLGSRFEDLDRE